MSALGSSGTGAGTMATVGAAGGGSGFGVAGAGFLAATGGLAFAGSFLAAGLLSAGASGPGGVSEICARALVASISTLASIDIGTSGFIPGAIPLRPWAVLASLCSLGPSPARHL